MRFLEPTDPAYEATLQALSRRSASVPPAIESAAREVIAAVRVGGDAAVRALTEKFEGRKLDALELDELDVAELEVVSAADRPLTVHSPASSRFNCCPTATSTVLPFPSSLIPFGKTSFTL